MGPARFEIFEILEILEIATLCSRILKLIKRPPAGFEILEISRIPKNKELQNVRGEQFPQVLKFLKF